VAAHITAKALTATVAAPDKVYDGNTTASATLTAVAGLVGNETVAASGTATFNSKDVVDANLVTVNSTTLADGSNGGLASNYSLASGQTVTAHITARTLTATVAAPDKVYDGNTIASATLNTLTGLIGNETVDASGTATFNSKDVADATLVTVNGTTLTDGNNGGVASNYSLASGQTVAARITPRVLTVVGQAALDKVYDGTTTATLTGGSLAGVVAGETVMLNEAGTFATADVGSDIAVTADDSLSGIAAANYTVAQPTGLAADITAAIGPESPAVPESPPAPETPPVNVTSTAGYQSTVGEVGSNAQTTPVSPLPLDLPLSGSSSGGSTAYDLAGLNLTIITRDGNLPPGVQSQNTTDDEK
jgi:hypothetical protein